MKICKTHLGNNDEFCNNQLSVIQFVSQPNTAESSLRDDWKQWKDLRCLQPGRAGPVCHTWQHMVHWWEIPGWGKEVVWALLLPRWFLNSGQGSSFQFRLCPWELEWQSVANTYHSKVWHDKYLVTQTQWTTVESLRTTRFTCVKIFISGTNFSPSRWSTWYSTATSAPEKWRASP